MKAIDKIHESYLEPGTHFTSRKISLKQVTKDRRKYMNITAMLWICNRAKISFGYLEQGHTLIMIWIN